MQRWLAGLLLGFILTACAQPAGTRVDTRSITIMTLPWPHAIVASPDAPPQIVSVWLSSTQILPGRDWLGRVATTTNVASLEVRTESFSFNATRVAFGQFVFRQHVLDIVPQYKRSYNLQIIARNAAGARNAWVVPIVLR